MISRVWLSEDRTEIAWLEDGVLTVYDTTTLRDRTPDRLEGEWTELWLPDNR